jgi:hypothetical protein
MINKKLNLNDEIENFKFSDLIIKKNKNLIREYVFQQLSIDLNESVKDLLIKLYKFQLKFKKNDNLKVFLI